MRGYGMEAKPQCSRRRRACTGYVFYPFKYCSNERALHENEPIGAIGGMGGMGAIGAIGGIGGIGGI
tara:strand:+ start:330 stop:530 length:201 start_codon:yes stop_codon:yes gene_type:complete